MGCAGQWVFLLFIYGFFLSLESICAPWQFELPTDLQSCWARISNYPAPIAYYLAHEIGHIALGHTNDATAIVDLSDPLEQTNPDEEEQAADRFALELLTGKAEITVTTETRHFGARQLAQNLLEIADLVRVEPGTLALCFGHSTQNWATAQAAMNYIYTNKKPVWEQVNQVALRELDLAKISEDQADFLRAVVGGIFDALAIQFTILEPTNEETRIAAEIEFTAQRESLDLDVGESQLCAIIFSRAVPRMVTGDKRAIRAFEILFDHNAAVSGLIGKIICLEQLVQILLARETASLVRDAICKEPDTDRSLSICLNCCNPSANSDTWIEGLQSYVEDLRKSAEKVLVP